MRAGRWYPWIFIAVTPATACTFDPTGADFTDAAGPPDAGVPDAPPADAEPPCPPDWTAAGTRCYLVLTEPLAWDGAQAACVAAGGALAVIDDASENERVRALDDQIDPWWLGASDLAKEGTFVWVDGSELGFTAWLTFQPDNLFDEDCLEQNIDGAWNDAGCEIEQPAVCERASTAAGFL